ncbi:hypothetical protein DENSPDRAFT_835530 [Dentipellis sp. KUC8613]|nr:hypothetical protein DENSPDRAFT_835530 [Dentipellis sp. KUC8613]
MFRSFRKKPKKGDAQEGKTIRTSPSLPELSAQGIPWPEDLVDMSSIRQTPPPGRPVQGATRTSFSSPGRSIPFHMPFRGPPGRPSNANGNEGTISSLYMSHPPSAFDNWRTSTSSHPTSRPSQRRSRVPAAFNLMVAGGQRTGKTSLLRLLLDTADISPTATAEQRATVDRFMRGGAKRTEAIQTARVEICESRFDRVVLQVIDTPGLDFQDGRELRLERQVTQIVKYLDTQYADTMSEESKVIRQSKGDQHVHLCIYIIDPSSIMTVAARRQSSSLPNKTRSETTISHRPPDTPSLTDDSDDDSDDEFSPEKLTMSPAELRVIQRLSQHTNVLPVIGHADALTDEKLAAAKEAIRRELRQAGLDFGVFGPAKPKVAKDAQADDSGVADGNSDDGEEEEPKERKSRSIIKLRIGRKSSVTRSRSRSRSGLASEARDDREPVSPDPTDRESIANVRFSAHVVAKMDLSDELPFAVVGPEHLRRRGAAEPPSADASNASPSVVAPSEDGHAASTVESMIGSPTSQSNHSLRNLPYLEKPPEDLKGVFTRKFRWGTIDVLDPNHCDFPALRTAVLSTHMKVLKTHTKEVLYEKYRTEKLLARRATQNIGEKGTKRLLEDLGL